MQAVRDWPTAHIVILVMELYNGMAGMSTRAGEVQRVCASAVEEFRRVYGSGASPGVWRVRSGPRQPDGGLH